MNKEIIIAALTTFLLCSCGEFLQGMSMALSGMNSYGLGYTPVYSSSGSSSGNLDYLLDPNYAYMQTQQQMSHLNAVNNQLLQVSAKQVEDAAEKEYQEAKKYRPNLTRNEYMLEKGSAYQALKQGSNLNSSVQVENSGSKTMSLRQCSHCHGTGKVPYESSPGTLGQSEEKVKCQECGISYLKSFGHTHITCPICHGKCYH